MMPDPLHLDCNFAKRWALKHDLAANNIDIDDTDQPGFCPSHDIGITQARLHSNMIKAGHKRYVERLRNRKSTDKEKQKQTEIRYDGQSTIEMYRSFAMYNDSLIQANGKESKLEYTNRIRLRTEMLLQCRMSHAYSQYEMDRETLGHLKQAGQNLHSLWKTQGERIGLNDTTITHALPTIIEKWFAYFRFGDGLKCLSPGITGSNQGTEHKHADTKERAKTQTNQRTGWTLKLLRDEAVRRFGEIFHPKKSPLGSSKKSTASYRYPDAADFAAGGKHATSCRSCLKNIDTSAELDFTGNSKEGALNYDPNRFEVAFLHYDSGMCCGECAQCLDYLREVVYGGEATGKWKQIHDEAVGDNAAVVDRHTKARMLYARIFLCKCTNKKTRQTSSRVECSSSIGTLTPPRGRRAQHMRRSITAATMTMTS
jgi:hypothetical protein